MKKVLFVMPTLTNGGAERSLVNLLCELPKDKYEIDLLLFKKKGIFIKQVPDYVNIIDASPVLYKMFAPLSESGKFIPRKVIGTGLSKICKKTMEEQKAFRWEYFYKSVIEDLNKEYDVAVGYLGSETTYYIVDHVKAKKKFHWVHNDYRKLGMPKAYDQKLFQKLDGIVTISEECLTILNEEFPEYKEKCYNIANITSSKVLYQRADEFYPEEYNDVEMKLLSVGRLNQQKGFDLAISAAKIMKEQGLKFKWYIIGAGALEGALNSQIEKENVGDCIELIGIRENPYPYIKNCDILVQPSRFEGKSVVLDEAKILGKPIVATAYPTVKDQINDGVDGVIVPLNPEGIADGLLKVANDKELRERLSDYLNSNEYGNQDEIEKYIALIG